MTKSKHIINGEKGLSYTQQIKWDKNEKAFWTKYFNNPPAPEDIPQHSDHLSFRSSDITDEEIGFVVSRISSINMLDLDDAYIGYKAIDHLTKLEDLKELRLKGCTELDYKCVPYLVNIKGLELLQLVNTQILVSELINMSSLTSLKKLFISQTITPQLTLEMRRLKKELPGCAFYVNYKLYEDEED